MALYVVDSNVAVKWTAMEPLWQQARRLLEDDENELIAPASFLPETLNALVKKQRDREIDEQSVRAAVAAIQTSVALYPLRVLIGRALDLSLLLTITVHDALFVALALREGCSLVTDDRRLINATSPAFAAAVTPLESLPGL